MREDRSDRSRPQAARLPGELAVLLDGTGTTLQQIDAFAVGIGPGSFTGLRIGIATMQGLAVAAAKPLFGISALDALTRRAGAAEPGESDARRIRQDGRLATWVDAWRGEVYAALYENGREVEPPAVARPEALLGRLAGRPVLFTGDGASAYEALIRAARGNEAHFTDPIAPLLAGAIGALAAAAFEAGERPAPDAIRPLYVRRSDAELARDRA